MINTKQTNNPLGTFADRFAGIFHKWQLANWTQPRPPRKGIVGTGQKEFFMDLMTGELTIKRKGIYFFYSHVSLHVDQVDIFI